MICLAHKMTDRSLSDDSVEPLPIAAEPDTPYGDPAPVQQEPPGEDAGSLEEEAVVPSRAHVLPSNE
jgi:hypothetical protein